MNKPSRVNAGLIEEISVLKRRIKELEQSESERKRAEKSLRESEEKYRSLASTVDSMVLVDRDCRVLFANDNFLGGFGPGSDSVIGRKFDEYHNEETSRTFTDAVKYVFETGNPYQDEWFSERRCRWILRTFSPVKNTDGNVAAVTSAAININDHKRAAEALRNSEKSAKRLAKEYELIAEIGRIISSTLDIDEVYERFAEKVREIIPFDNITISIVNTKDNTRTVQYASGMSIKDRKIGDVVPLHGTITERVVHTRSNLVINIKDKEELLRQYPGLLNTVISGIQSMMTIALISKAEVIAVLFFRSIKPNTYTEEDLIFAERVGSQIAGAVANAQLFLERKRVEEELRKSKMDMIAIIDNLPFLAWLKDSEGHFVMVNEPFARSCGSSSTNDLVGKTDLDIWPKKLAESYRADDFEVMRTGQKKAVEEFISDRGVERWFETYKAPLYDVYGNVTGTTGFARDITARKQAEEVLKESESKYRTLAEQALIGVCIVQDGVFKYVNPKYAEIHGYTVDELLDGFPFQKLVPPKYRQMTDERIKERLAGNSADAPYYLKKVKKNGEIIDAVHFGTVKSFQGKPALFGFLLDITEQKRLESERLSLEERLQRAEKMETLGNLAGGVAHDLNNVLGVASGYSELLMEKTPAGTPLREYAASILKSTEKAAAIIQDLLTLTRRGVMVFEVIDFNSIVTNLLATPEFDKLLAYHPHVTVSHDLDKDLLNIKGSPVHLEKTMMNLVSNAVEAISGNGEVNIRTENRYLDKAVQGYDKVKEGDYVVLTISDTGAGISSEDMNKMFEPFYTKKKMGRSGTGLGLAIVWGTVKDHEGYIDIQSTEGRGTTFTLYFPVTREKKSKETRKVPIEQYMGHGESVLVVDDVLEQRQVATALLKDLGYQVNSVTSGEEAVEYLKINKVDILVLDMIMEPGIDGLETFKRILEINPRQKAIIVSGFSETDRTKEAQKLGAGAYVKKPYLMEMVGMAIRDELDRN